MIGVSDAITTWAENYPSTSMTNPTGPTSGQYRVIRGGAWDEDEDYMRSTFREMAEPVEYNYTLGFRCVSVQSP